MHVVRSRNCRSLVVWGVFALAALLFLGKPAVSQDSLEIQGLRVLDAGFEEVARLRDPVALRALERLWGQFAPAEGAEIPVWTHKLDIESDQIGGRWLYSREGYVARLDKELESIYRVPDPGAFNALLGL